MPENSQNEPQNVQNDPQNAIFFKKFKTPEHVEQNIQIESKIC